MEQAHPAPDQPGVHLPRLLLPEESPGEAPLPCWLWCTLSTVISLLAGGGCLVGCEELVSASLPEVDTAAFVGEVLVVKGGPSQCIVGQDACVGPQRHT